MSSETVDETMKQIVTMLEHNFPSISIMLSRPSSIFKLEYLVLKFGFQIIKQGVAHFDALLCGCRILCRN